MGVATATRVPLHVQAKDNYDQFAALPSYQQDLFQSDRWPRKPYCTDDASDP